MRKALKKDQSKAVEILSRSFRSNPSVNAVIKNDSRANERIKALCQYSFKTALLRDGAYISSNEKGIALCYRYNYKKESFADYWNQFLLATKAIGFSRVLPILKREHYIKSKRPLNGNYLYFWFLGTLPDAQDGKAARELKDAILKKSTELHLPIYLETSVAKNKRVYERYGFEVYHTWTMDENGTVLYFMRRIE